MQFRLKYEGTKLLAKEGPAPKGVQFFDIHIKGLGGNPFPWERWECSVEESRQVVHFEQNFRERLKMILGWTWADQERAEVTGV
jgi:hypothetical protein